MDLAAVLVIGHTRTEHLKNTLQSLARQGAIKRTHVWLDGHGGCSHLIQPVYDCRSIATHFEPAEVVAYNGNVGLSKLALDALEHMSHLCDCLIVLEDDSFPTYSAVRVFGEDLKRIEDDPAVFSVYGHHFLLPSEGETLTRFQGWGWATTMAKLGPVLEQARDCFSWSEPRYLRWVEDHLTPQVCARLQVTSPRDPIPNARTFYCLDACISLITASAGLSHRKTSRRVVYNCGLGQGSSHFRDEERFRQPPFNMISPSEVWQVWED